MLSVWCGAKGKPVAGIELTRFSYPSNSWSEPRWVTGIRQHVGRRDAPKGKTLSLFAGDPVIGKFRFSALVSDMDLPAEALWRTYRGRADCENRIKELKYDFAADSLGHAGLLGHRGGASYRHVGLQADEPV